MSFMAALAIPRACAATDGRDKFKEDNKMDNPSPGAPNKLALGTRQSSKASVQVEEPFMPIFFSLEMAWNPGASLGSISTLMACLGSSMPDHLPNKRVRSATSPLVIKIFEPLITISSPSSVKVVAI